MDIPADPKDSVIGMLNQLFYATEFAG